MLVAKEFTQTEVDYFETFSFVAKFTTFVKSQGYSQGHSDHSLFIKVSKVRKIVVLIVYVDDIVLFGDEIVEIVQLKKMGDELEIKELGNLKYFFGVEIASSEEGIFVSQRKYTFDLLTETGMMGCQPANTSIAFNAKLENSVDKEKLQHLVGKLIYLSHTRLDICYVVSTVKNLPLGTLLSCWAISYIGGEKQYIVARNNTEAEYRAMSLGICEEIWLQKCYLIFVKTMRLDKYLELSERSESVSAFSPIANPVNCPWGQKAFTNYLGSNKADWEEYDATHLISKFHDLSATILIDQGEDDEFLHGQLLPHKFEEACRAVNAPLLLRLQPGYNHSYFFIASFMDDHIRHHSQALRLP
ncbi:S-formylglutathione hydrolase [Cucumis melo var. makuwa]|uniref:S-formylglutathione hydrolase n=1 Tax=Cucumis melo var. makuwa TaxID=1194695 RepID=A0A5A7VL13_CUCMM|nr:S-formylglutathione hydrolase [Cucumis melo var. makuwa]